MRKKSERSETLIANFKDCYAEGWYFAVHEAFKDALDIKYLPRMKLVLDQNREPIKVQQKDKHGNLKFKKNGEPALKDLTEEKMVWTQGTAYCFDIGHIIYDTPKAYEDWITALQHINIACKVKKATQAGVTKEDKGMVLFETFKPDAKRKKLVHTRLYRTDQVQFVSFLQSGKLDESWEEKSGDIISITAKK